MRTPAARGLPTPASATSPSTAPPAASGSTAGGANRAIFLSPTGVDWDVSTSVVLDKTPTGGSAWLYHELRRTTANTNSYRLLARFANDGTTWLSASRVINGSEVTIGNPVAVPSVNYRTGFTLRGQLTGTNPTTIRVKAWTGNEPTAWNYTATDSAGPQVAGRAGLRTYTSGGTSNTPITLTIDNYSAATAAAAPPPPPAPCRHRPLRRPASAAPPPPPPGDDVTFVGAGDIASSGSGDAATAACSTASREPCSRSGTAPTRTARRPSTWPTTSRPGAAQEPHHPGHRQPRIQPGQPSGVLRLLRSRSGRSGEGLLLDRRRGVARHRAELELRDRLLRGRFGPGAVATGRPGCEPRSLHRRAVPPSALLVGRLAQQQHVGRAVLERLYEFNADLVLNGHDHAYERFAPQNPNAGADPARGIQEFVVGTGGVGISGFSTIQPNSVVRGLSLGVLQLTLEATGYDFRFVPIAGQTFTDVGTGTCH